MPGGGGQHDAPSEPDATSVPTGRDLEGLIEDIPEAFVLYDGDGRIVYANEEFRRRMGRTMAELVGRRPFEWDDGSFADSADVANFRALLGETLATGEPRTFTREQTGLDGERQSYRVSFRAQRDTDGHVVGAFMFAQDVSDLAVATSTVRRQEHEFRVLTESLPDVIVRYDLDGRAVYRNHRSATGGGAAETLGLRPSEMDRPSMRGVHEFEARLMEVLSTGEPGEATLTFDLPDGRHTHSLLIRAEHDADGAVSGALVIGRDVTDLIAAQESIARREREFRSLAENATEFIGRWSPSGVRLYVNPALAALMGQSPEELIGQPSRGGMGGLFSDVTDAIAICAEEATPRTVLHTYANPDDGSERVHEIQLVPEFDEHGTVVSVLGVGRDVTTVTRQREELERASRTDSLTGAANRRVLYEVLPEAIAAAGQVGRHVALILTDLDGFKHLNDLYGHTFGDRLLRAVADVLAACTSPDRPAIRLGGDEFVLIAEVDSPTDAALVAHGIQVVLGRPGRDDERFPPVDACFGIAMSPHDGTEPDMLLAAADLALHAAKQKGRGRVEFYRAELRAAAERRSVIEDALRSAVPDVEMDLFLQPICELGSSGAVWGVEALLRWRHPVLGQLSPAEFIPVAEQCGQIVPLGRWVLARAAAIAADLNRDRSNPLRVCVNVSTRQFTLDDVADAVVDALRTSGCDPRWIQLELTESLLLEEVPLVHDVIDRLRALGVGIAIDDFGTGYSALHYLTKLPIDHLKIDKSFVRDVETDSQQQEIVRALVALASAIDVDVVAEGIETEGQADFLRGMGCGLGQGFLLAMPMPCDQLVGWLTRRKHSARSS